MSLKNIYKNLGIETDLEEEYERFKNRLRIILDHDNTYWMHNYSRLYKQVVFTLGLPSSKTGEFFTNLINNYQDIDRSIEKNMILLHAILSISHSYISEQEQGSSSAFKYFSSEIKNVFDSMVLNIGFRFDGKNIIKSGATELDDVLIIENLAWLDKFPDSREKYSNALNFYLRNNYSDAITNLYSALEGIVKAILQTNKSLDDEKLIYQLIQKLNLDSHWGQILHHYCKIAHEYSSRHGKKKQEIPTNPEPRLVEFYLYITGSILRLISQEVT